MTFARGLAIVALASFLAACGPAVFLYDILRGTGPSGREAALLLLDIAAGPGPSTLKEEVPPPSRTEILWGYDADGIADLYMPADGDAKARVVFIPGLSELGKDDWRLVPMAESLARAGFAVMVPDIENIRRLRVSPGDAEEIGRAAVWLSQTELSGRGSQKVGIVGASYAAGPGLLAATDPDYRDAIAFVFTIGAYYDIESAMIYAVTGKHREAEGDPWITGDPNAFARWTFVRANAPRVPDARDQVTLSAIAQRKIADGKADVSDLVAQLGPEGRVVWDLFTTDDPERALQLMARLPAPVKADIEGLDLVRRDLSQFGGEAILIHGQDDPTVPAWHSRRLAEAMGPGATLYLAQHLNHAEFKGEPDFWDQFTLWRAAYRLLAIRDELAAESPRQSY